MLLLRIGLQVQTGSVVVLLLGEFVALLNTLASAGTG